MRAKSLTASVSTVLLAAEIAGGTAAATASFPVPAVVTDFTCTMLEGPNDLDLGKVAAGAGLCSNCASESTMLMAG